MCCRWLCMSSVAAREWGLLHKKLKYFSLQWFNLNSLLTGPELISDTYLALFLAQLQQEGNVEFTWTESMLTCQHAENMTKVVLVQVILYLSSEETSRSVKQSRFSGSWGCSRSSGPGLLERMKPSQVAAKGMNVQTEWKMWILP